MSDWQLREDDDGQFILTQPVGVVDESFRVYISSDPEQATREIRNILAAPKLLGICERLSESAAYWSEYDVPLGIVDDLNRIIGEAGGTVTQ